VTASSNPMNCVDTILDLFATRGGEAYLGEPISQREHALQAAYLASREQAPDALVAAALLHDIGHLLTLDESAANRGIDQHHEAHAARWLTAHLGPEITEPIRLHVAAKRYLCAVEPEYMLTLSPASIRSLELQGGPLTREGALRFQESLYHRHAVRVRRWDEGAKVPGWEVPEVDEYINLLRRCLTSD
jgi:phosphonate degradation associated HDIG domain protein